MNDSAPQKNRRASTVVRIAGVCAATTAFTLFLNYSTSARNGSGEPAGFFTGIVHGVLMPTAMPALAVGRDVRIYAEYNNGRLYKLGYTLGVNGCGAVFFGLFYRRISTWKKSATKQG